MTDENDKRPTLITGVGIEKECKQPPKQASPPKKKEASPPKKIEVNNDGIENERKNGFRRTNKLYERIKYKIPPDDNYYELLDELYGITPGIQFIKKIFSHDNCEKAIPTLRLNIPETYWNDTEMFYVCNDLRTGALKMIRNKKDFDLYESICHVESTQYKRKYKDIDPFAIIRTKESEYENMVKVERYEKSEDNLGKDLGEGIAQRYIRCRGRNRDLDLVNQQELPNIAGRRKTKDVTSAPMNHEELYKTMRNDGGEERKQSMTQPTVVRLEYKTGYNPSKGANIAYCLINKTYVERSIKSGSKEVIEKYNQLTTLNTKDEHSFDIYIMSGESVAPFEFYAKQLVLYLQRWFKMLLKTIVCDFMKDERGIIYFLGCKSITLVKHPKELLMGKPDTRLINVNDERNLVKFYKTWICRLCLLPYPQSKITKIVTFKLLYKLKENLKKRGFTHFDHINNNIYSESQSCRVCDLCYKLLVTEQELMEIQKTIALCSNIEVQNDELLSNVSQAPTNVVRAQQKYKNLVQWRIMFYFVKFYNFDYSNFPFDDDPDNKKKHSDKKDLRKNYKLCITLFNQRLSIPIFTELKDFISEEEVELNKAKMFYFFSSENSNVKQIMRNEEVDFRLVLNDKWNEPLAQCKTTCFSCYDDGVKEKPLTSKTILNFFSEYIKHFKCQMYFGLKNDGMVPTEGLQMYCYKLPNAVYLTDLDYYSYHPLPNDWYELYIPPDTQLENDEDAYDADKEIAQILKNLEGKEKKKKEENDDEVYDPYDVLVEVQNKNNIINKINSIPIVLDKAYIEMKRDEKKIRPKTALLQSLFHFPQIDSKQNFKKKKTIPFKEPIKEKTMDELLREADEKTLSLTKINKALDDGTN